MRARVSFGALVICLFAACSKPPLRVGTTGDYRPFSIWDAHRGEFNGVDIDLARSFAKSQGREVVFVRTTWPTLMHDLTAGAFDVALSGISITPEREWDADFSLPYYHGSKIPIVRCSDKTKWKNLDQFDRPHVRIIYNPGGTNEVFARNNLPNASLDEEADNLKIVNRVASGEADAFFTDSIEAVYYTYHRNDVCRALEGAELAPFDIAAIGPHGSEEVDRLNTWLRLPASTHLTTAALKTHIADTSN